MKTKAEIRKTLAAQIAKLSPAQKARASAHLCGGLLADEQLQSPCKIGIFLPLSDEPDLRLAYQTLLANGHQLALPFPEWDFHYIHNLSPESSGPWDLEFPRPGETVAASALDLILVPGRGFTKNCQRIGRGKGIYDRLLSNSKTRCIGIGFACQDCDELPSEAHDILMSEVWLGETRAY
jgi:5-formyltetrahydrofolate cyclo-ligase